MTLRAQDLTFRYQSGNRRILNRFSLTLTSGDIVGLRAPSGFGKTTLCKILAGYMPPDSGAVTLDNKPIHSFRGYCPVQLIGQHPELVVNPRLRMEQTLKEAGIADERILSGLGIEKAWLRRYPAELSGGEQQRFCIARALHKETRFLLCDEISTMLDLITQAQIWGFLIDEAKQRNLGLLVVSHSDALLKRLCTRIVDMRSEIAR